MENVKGGFFLKKVVSLLLLVSFLCLSFEFKSYAMSTEGYLDNESNRTMVPLRFISEELGAKVDWNAQDKTINIGKEGKQIFLTINQRTVKVNGVGKTIEAAPVIVSGSTYVPIRMVTESFGANIVWNASTSSVSIYLDGKEINLLVKQKKSNNKSNGTQNKSSSYKQQTFKVGSKSIKANLVTVDIRNPNVKLDVALARDRVGGVEGLASLAKRKNAKIAINGTFFNAYDDVIKEPYGLIISNGKVVHLGRGATVFSFDQHKKVRFDILDPNIAGATNESYKWPDNWYAYWFNRTPSKNGTSVVIFTRDFGKSLGFHYGTNVIVENRMVTSITTGNVEIPENGYVINLTGTEKDSLINRFKVGTTIDYRIEVEESKQRYFDQLKGALGVGPRLVTDGKVTVNPKSEGFTSVKILSNSGARSAIGLTKKGKLLLVTTNGATIQQLAHIMQQVGAYQAMNLDGGASSGLYYHGKYITAPGRDISNALLIYE